MRRIHIAIACASLVFACARKEERKEERVIQYLEIVTPDVDKICETYAKSYGLTFSTPIAELGNARTAELSNGGRIGVRAPLRPDETPVVRPYVLVEDVAKAAAAAEAAGAVIAVPPMELPGQGTFAIFIQGGIENGLWQHSPKTRL
jgi:predicted enzyme related to lactoylglutathione lyase